METVIHSDNDFATVAYLRIKEAALQPKASLVHQQLAVPPLLEEPFSRIRDLLGPSTPSTDSENQPSPTYPSFHPRSHKRIGDWVSVANVQRDFTEHPDELTVEDEVRECFEQLQGTSDLLSHLFVHTNNLL